MTSEDDFAPGSGSGQMGAEPPAGGLGRPGRLDAYGLTVFSEMSALALATGAINLGQGFPDTDGPREVIEAAIEAIRNGENQYPPGRGVQSLLEAIADHESTWWDLEFDPENEILVTAGATEAIAASIMGLCQEGDEVVIFEPYYDSYAATIELAGARRRVVPLRPPDWTFDPAASRRRSTRHTADTREHAAQPDRQGAQANRAEGHSQDLHRSRPHRGRRRGVRAPRLRRGATCPCPACRI